MAKTFENLKGDKLEDWFKSFLTTDIGFNNYYPSAGQIELSILDPSQAKGNHLEIDGVLLINKTCIFLEYTSENSNFKNKIKKFNRNCNLFISSKHLTLEKKFELFDIPHDKLEDFAEAEKIISRTFKNDKENYFAGMLLAKTFNASGKFEKSIDLLKDLKILPYEHSTEGREIYTKAYIGSASQNLMSDNNKKAIMFKTYLFNKDSFSITKEVQYENSEDKFIRNKQTYKRI